MIKCGFGKRPFFPYNFSTSALLPTHHSAAATIVSTTPVRPHWVCPNGVYVCVFCFFFFFLPCVIFKCDNKLLRTGRYGYYYRHPLMINAGRPFGGLLACTFTATVVTEHDRLGILLAVRATRCFRFVRSAFGHVRSVQTYTARPKPLTGTWTFCVDRPCHGHCDYF